MRTTSFQIIKYYNPNFTQCKDFLEQILRACKNNGVHTAVDTAGNVPWEYFERILPYTDLFLYDVKCFSSKLHKEGTGVGNDLILDNLEKLSATFRGEIMVRIPLIPGYNTLKEEISKIAEFLRKIGVKSVETLPYHAMGEHKWEALGAEVTSYPTLEKECKKEIDELINKILVK
jgi:pyruvate formate lyase activating enzyme